MTLVLQAGDRVKAGAAMPPKAPETIDWSLPGFGPLTRINTTIGLMHAHALRVRDAIVAGSGQVVEILSVDRIHLDKGFLDGAPDAQPIRLQAGCLGANLPRNDIILSPGQHVGVTRDTFLKARDLLGHRGVARCPESMMTYTTFRCSGPATVEVEGLWARIGV